ncbi:ASCH domain-containing protein [Janthinobacterium sp. PSPC2-1]|uniref:ASCH domain-containing protein n=1 Tax=unclassified Janthinobacterium TaxID=2610881 RepID=UPI003CFB2A25
MIPSQNCSQSPTGSSILISIKPRYADLILAGSKHVELRRAAPTQAIKAMAIYSSSPIQAIVALVEIVEVIEASASRLWEIARDNGGGLTRSELRGYYSGKKTGFAIMLGKVRQFDSPIEPHFIFSKFTPPQSFRYLTPDELKKLEKLLIKRKKS